MPLPNGDRVNGNNQDKFLQHKMWDALGLEPGSLAGKSVLDIGANDGFFSIAALMVGAKTVTSLNSADWSTWPQNISFACDIWNVKTEIITGDFRTYVFNQKFDIILFLGVIYHVQDVFGAINLLGDLLAPGGSMYIETHITNIESQLPIFEVASDFYKTSAPQGRESVSQVGISNFLLPNVQAIQQLALTYDLKFEHLNWDKNVYSKENPWRQMFKLGKT